MGDGNFATWNRSRYGEYLWNKFFEPYNKKYWDMDLKELDACWIGSRIYQPTVEEILYGSYTEETPNTYYAPEMRYPRSGGYFSFVKSVADAAEDNHKLHLRKKVKRILPADKAVIFDDGSEIGYRKLYSSIPLPVMISLTDGMEDLTENAKRLEHTSVAIVSVGMSAVNISRMWFYIYDEDILAARAYMPSVKSPYNVPDGSASIQFEIYFNCNKPVPDEKDCVDNCKYALRKIGICEEKQILFTDFRILPYGNVVFKKDTAKLKEKLLNRLNGRGISMIGRFGMWEYLWSDQAFLSGYDAVRAGGFVHNGISGL